jgi:hypothetical protein
VCASLRDLGSVQLKWGIILNHECFQGAHNGESIHLTRG